MTAKIRRTYKMENDPLHNLLLRACPPHSLRSDGTYVPDENGVKSISVLAQTLSLSRMAITKWVQSGRVPPRQVRRMVDNNPREVTLADFSPFVYF